ncbi:MAG: heparinase II/III family protein [Brevundimonas sp.]|uniref:heparinase II/III domain-containing protein n=2 Tax=Brevundimonas sp. TaxID=1871086 RepID=UPI00272760D6|nr:heparinase II/III family protein [Brevundimonas sp.]MDO9588545.1 heparinase II/III family protein [Brevundimonas sp.]MDP3655936.1 heparinase II/III family protein [Brevundimonas sp.]
MLTRTLSVAGLVCGCAAAPLAVAAQTPAAPATATAFATADNANPVLVSSDDWARMAEAGDRYPMFAAERVRVELEVRAAMHAGINVPQPRDLGGGITHEQHKANYKAIAGAGALYRLTGDRAYADFARDILLEYALLYPALGPHPAGRSSVKGRLFWQALNDSVWLVYASQGYDAIRDTLSVEHRRRIDDDVFRRMAAFLSEHNADYFDRIHNHATWATAGVGMTGYVLRDPDLVDRALRGTRLDGRGGFLRQIDLLFSPDGYYAEGPYYQRYALAPFVIFARAIERNEPERGIFRHRDGVLLKAVDGVLQASYGGLIIPINDAMPDKGLDSEEIVTGVAIAYAQTGDPGLLSIAGAQGRTLLSPDGLAIAEGMASGAARPFGFRSMQLRDGPDGDLGNLVFLRDGGPEGQMLVMKNTQQGQGHGHFDRLNWLFYDNGVPVIRDYGAARFLNIEAKNGGGYLDENDSWATQTVAHNTLVVDGENQFGGDWRRGEAHGVTPLLFEIDGGAGVQIASARTADAYPGVTLTRTLVLVEHPDLAFPLAIDLMRVEAARPGLYDLPLHFNGHIITQGFQARHAVSERPVLGDRAGYQHLWVDAQSEPGEEGRSLTWLLDGRFYTYRFAASAPTRALLVESGANDPNFNLRREQALIRRMEGQADASFVAVLEPHGAYDSTAETVTGSTSRIREIARYRSGDAEVVVVTLASGKLLALGIAGEIDAGRRHAVRAGDHTYQWAGPWARFDRETAR